MTPWEAVDAIKAAIETGVDHPIAKRVQTDPGFNVRSNLPAIIVGPPDLTFASLARPPTDARFEVYVIVGSDANVLRDLLALVPQVAAAIDTYAGDAVCISAEAGVWSGDLPCYILTVEYNL